ncbi:MAG: prepilin-type N-terminal cleavage/methylation domain-containing protein [Candidatus Omnitrophota bacterium]|nr:prepilin-type N-terminal cleavage/methylation domain-containing protein [Candidatus Omnitrophota bacterium]MDZ4243216.1 prepilin-type N-terminal cleavage/methylation domain-containing protein [Candidatus Omnitrophota bacterium]
MGRRGFTLLELVIVIIIVGVLASLALPRFFQTVEFSRTVEARTAIGAIRQAAERCYMMRGDFFNCPLDFQGLGIDDPGASPNAHFIYALSYGSPDYLVVQAIRNTRDGGSFTEEVRLCQDGDRIIWCGAGKYRGLDHECPWPVNACE